MSFTRWLSIALLLGTSARAQDPGPQLIVTEPMVTAAAEYPGAETERHLIDLARADFHAGQAVYYRDRSKSGFMALERFALGLDHAIGDIRVAAHITDDKTRFTEVVKTFQNWQQAFLRAPRLNRPEGSVQTVSS